jgi:hypothetical protein
VGVLVDETARTVASLAELVELGDQQCRRAGDVDRRLTVVAGRA